MVDFLLDNASVLAALIVSLTTFLTVVLGFIIKDYCIPSWHSNRNRKIVGQDLFSLYKTNLTKVSLSLLYRLKEISSNKGLYLRADSPKLPFYEYKYKSSVYRLCSLLGWIRAYRILESSMIIKQTDEEFHKLSEIISKVESAIADGQKIEMYAAKSLLEIANIDITKLQDGIVEKLSTDIDHCIQKNCEAGNVFFINELGENQLSIFVQQLQSIINLLPIQGKSLIEYKNLIAKELSIVVALLYRDWQSAIGDLMLTKEGNNYNVISYRVFEDLWDNTNSSEKKWLERAEVMFKNLDLRNHKLDSRIDQLGSIYEAVYSLISALYLTEVGRSVLNEKSFEDIPKQF